MSWLILYISGLTTQVVTVRYSIWWVSYACTTSERFPTLGEPAYLVYRLCGVKIPHCQEISPAHFYPEVKMRKCIYSNLYLRPCSALSPWPSRAFTEPPGPGEHALHRAGRARAVLARQARCSIAFVPLASPTLFRGAPLDVLWDRRARRTHWFAPWWHSVYARECHRTSSRLLPSLAWSQKNHSRCTTAHEQRDTVSISLASWQSGARVAVTVAGDVGLMGELSAVPLGQ